MRCSCLVLLSFHTMSSDTLKTKTASLLCLNQDRRFLGLLPTKVYDHKYTQKLHLTRKVKICSYVVLSYEGSTGVSTKVYIIECAGQIRNLSLNYWTATRNSMITHPPVRLNHTRPHTHSHRSSYISHIFNVRYMSYPVKYMHIYTCTCRRHIFRCMHICIYMSSCLSCSNRCLPHATANRNLM